MIDELFDVMAEALKNPLPPRPLVECVCRPYQRLLESSDINGWHRCQKCRGYVSRERVEDGR